MLLIFFLFYFLLLLYIYFQQKNFIFFPTKTKHQSTDKNRITYSFARNDSTLNGWLLNPSFASEKLIIYYGGNAEDIFFTIDQFREYGDCSILLVNYRGYGNSTGSPSEKALFDDALAIFDDIQSKYSPERIFLMGRSLGSGVASYTAANRSVQGIILITPFASIESLAKRQFFYMPVSHLLKHKFLSDQYVRQISAPCLVIYGGKDRTVPPGNTEELTKNIATETTLVFIEEAEHNNIELFDEYNLAILRFIE